MTAINVCLFKSYRRKCLESKCVVWLPDPFPFTKYKNLKKKQKKKKKNKEKQQILRTNKYRISLHLPDDKKYSDKTAHNLQLALA